ncbi:hypothetical protein NW755_014496 [Fusarium falciforme]|uniref:Uncharacterized protein n=1 Tax=Fusarium falciforme TaxID=195108 RepID=A0A9W8UUI9_9HYPO|nr:hypothetical protein NW755_014496 [Fusarium falciforme]KAJ4228753.1 hypothetical protein NW757_014137 [Fusarium falciforme]
MIVLALVDLPDLFMAQSLSSRASDIGAAVDCAELVFSLDKERFDGCAIGDVHASGQNSTVLVLPEGAQEG